MEDFSGRPKVVSAFFGILTSLVMWTASAGASALAPAGQSVWLGDVSGYHIVIPAQPTAQDERSGLLLSEALWKMASVKVSVEREPASGGRAFYIGETVAAKNAGVPRLEALQGYRIDVRGDSVYLMGGTHGPVLAVLAVLEEDWGVRWYAKGEQGSYPRREPGSFTLVPRSYQTPFLVREALHESMMDEDWALLNRYQPASNFFHGNYPYGGALSHNRVFCHTYDQFLPSAKFFKDHPEYYPLRNGKRFPSDGGHGQLCYTSVGVADEIARQLEARIAREPQYRIYAVSANDNLELECECPGCAKLIASDGICGAEMHLANAVAERLAPKHPDIRLTMLAYVESQKVPPNVKPHPNVIVIYAPIRSRAGADQLRTWTEMPEIMEEFNAWRASGARLGVWDYALRGHVLNPNFEVMRDNIRLWREAGVEYVFLEENEFCRNSLEALRSWVFAKLMWNPDWSLSALVNDFLVGYYGPSAKAMSRYIKLQMDAWRRFHAHNKPGDDVIYTPEEKKGMRDSLDAAMTTAGTDRRLREHVAREICSFLVMELKGCRKDRIAQYEADLSRMKALTKEFDLALDETFTPSKSAAQRNAKLFARWDGRLNDAKYGNPLPVHCADSIVLKEKKPWYAVQRVTDPGALTNPALRFVPKSDWCAQWNFEELMASAPNQSYWVVRMRVKPDLKTAHSPDDKILGLHIARDGDKVFPGAAIKVSDLPENGTWGFVDFFRLNIYSPSATGYFWNAAEKLSGDDAVLLDYIELIPLEKFPDKAQAGKLPLLVL